MRSDAIGIFWQDIPRKGSRTARVMPPIPDTGWTTPTEFPNLSGAKAICFDVETKDPELDKNGPGWARGVGHLVGIAAGVPEGDSWYFPMRHEVEAEYNLDPERVLAWARDNFGNPSQPKLGANITYDIGWLREEGVYVKGPVYDVQFAEALLRESATVGLDDLGERYLGIGKTGELLYEWCSLFYGGAATQIQRRNIYRAPPRLVGPYAQGDVTLPFGVLERQWPLLVQEQLMDLFMMENRLIPLMIEMRYQGVRVDLSYAEELQGILLADIDEVGAEIASLVGFDINVNSSAHIAEAFDYFRIPYGRTKTGKPSFTKPFLESVEHPIADLIRKKRARQKLLGTFVESYILNSHIDGKLYGTFNQLRGMDSGARSGRFSSDHPNLQNIPYRSKLGKKIRRVFVPDYGHVGWRKYDYSQIEYRALAHYAVGPKSDDLRAQYNNDPNVDFHRMVQQIIFSVTGKLGEPDDRPIVKNINFGSTYGMGPRKVESYLNLPPAQAKELMQEIHAAAPFLRATMDATMAEAESLGYITTILGRRSRFDLWVPREYAPDAKPLPYDRAILAYRNPQRAYLHKSLNRRLQGSAADLIKKAMLDCWESGVFDETGVPRLTVHDELDFSDPGGKDEAFAEMAHIMETAVRFRVPVKVDLEVGPSWGEVQPLDSV